MGSIERSTTFVRRFRLNMGTPINPGAIGPEMIQCA